MGWECPDCTYLNSDADPCCGMCKYPAPAAVKRAAGTDTAVVDLVDLIDEDEEQQRSSGGMGSGGSKALDDAQWGKWDPNFCIELSGSPAAVSSPAQQRQTASGEHEPQWGAGGARAGSKVPAAKRKRFDGHEHAGSQAPLEVQGSRSSAETAVAAQAAAQVALASSDSVRSKASEQQQQRQPPERQGQQQQPQDEGPAGKRVRGMAQAQAVGGQAAVPSASSGTLSRELQRQPNAAPTTLPLPVHIDEALRKRKRDPAPSAPSQPLPAQQQPTVQGGAPQPTVQLSPVGRQATPAASGHPVRQGLQVTPVAAALSAHKATPRSAAEGSQPRLPKQASLRLPPRRSPVDKQLSASSRSGGAGAAAGCAATPPGQTSKPAQPAVQTSPATVKSSLVPYVQQWAGAATAVAAVAEQGFSSVPEVSGRQGKALSSSRPEDWQLAHAAFLALAIDGSKLERLQHQAQHAAKQPKPQDVQQQQPAGQQLSQSSQLPAWAQRARQGVVDLTPAVLGAASKCQPTGQEQWAQPVRLAVPGWLAYRVASQLPAAPSCCRAADLLHSAAGALRAAPLPVLGATLAAEPDPKLQPGSISGAGSSSSKGRQPAAMGWGQAAARLLAAASDQGPPLGLGARCKAFYEQPAAVFSTDLRLRLATELGHLPCGIAATGDRSTAQQHGARAGKRSVAGPSLQPSRFAERGGDAAGAEESDDCEDGSGTAQRKFCKTEYRGVRCAVTVDKDRRYQSSVWLNNAQLWLGTYDTIEQAARAVDLVAAYRWLSGGMNTEPIFNLPHANYLQDGDLVRKLTALPDVKALKAHIQSVCNASSSRGGYRPGAR
ncbi:hypothetical protein ACK3TF_000318 [Chlorella vulgaris]